MLRRTTLRCISRRIPQGVRSLTTEPIDIDELLDSFGTQPNQNLSSNVSSEANTDSTKSIDPGMSESLLKQRRDRTSSNYTAFGTTSGPSYSPREQLYRPPSIDDTGIAALLASQAHLGHSTTLWNPITQPFIYGVRDGIHIFNLDLTLAHLRRAASVVRGVAQNDGNIIFVGTRPGQKRIVVEAAERGSCYHVFDRWVPGTITNGKQVVGHGKFKHLLTRHENNLKPGQDERSAPNSIIPDLVIILNPLENRNLIKECAKGRVPTIGIIDSDADPTWVTYSIPANDDSLRLTSLVAGVLSRAAADGRQKMSLSGWIQEEVVTSDIGTENN